MKPTPKRIEKERLDYHDMMEYLEKKYNFESRYFTGIPSTMTETERRNTNTPYMDYWHYLCDINDELRNGCYINIPSKVSTSDDRTPQMNIEMFKKLLNQYPKDKEMRNNLEFLIKREEEEIKNPKVDKWAGWKQQITDLIFKEFGEFAKDDYLTVWVDW